MRAFESDHEDGDRLESLILEFDEALSGGLCASADDESVLSEPAIKKFRGAQATLRLLERARLDGFEVDGGAGSTTVPEPGRGASDDEADSPPLGVQGTQVGRFRLIGELGRGGYGVVFLAYDPQLGRQVALKIPRPEVLVGSATRRRFLREAQAAGGLEHPNLIPMYEAGEDGPFCYLASAYCDGPTLAQWLKRRAQAVPAATAARLIAALARGVEHAHRNGVLHRDIKPSNVLLDRPPDTTPREADEWVPRLTDFGLAKILELADDDTRSGALLGTPAYMAPEQAEGRLRDIGPATDVYALGVLLYELLAGRPPLRGENDVQTLQQVSRGEVPPLGQFRAGLARDLQAITLRCLEREPARRYASAGELATDLERYLIGEPTLARPAGVHEKLAKWAKRRPTVAALSAVTVLAAAAIAGGGWWYSGQLRTALTEGKLREAQTKQLLYVASVNRAERALSSNGPKEAYDQLARWIPQPGETDYRDFAWHCLWRQMHAEERSLQGHEGDVYCVRFSRDGTRMATASKDGTARIWSAATCECLHVLAGHASEVNCVAFSPDGALVATTSDDGTTRIWSVETGTVVQVLPERRGPTWCVEFSPDGALLAVSGNDKDAVLWNVENWTELDVLQGQTASIGELGFSHDGKLLATASDEGVVCLWDVDTRVPARWLAHGGTVNALSFDKYDRRLLTASKSGNDVRIWNVATGVLEEVPSTHYEVIHDVAFDPTNECYVVATKEGVVEMIRPEERVTQRHFWGHWVRVWSVDFSPDGRRMATASADRTVKIWVLADQNPAPIGSATQHVPRICATPDGRLTAWGNREGSVEVYDHVRGQVVWSLPDDATHDPAVPLNSVDALAISPRGDRIAVTHVGDSRIKIWDVAKRDRIAQWHWESSRVTDLAYSPDGATLAAGGNMGQLVLYDADTCEPVRQTQAHERFVDDMEFSVDGQILATAGDDASIKLWDRRGQLIRTLCDESDGTRYIAISRDGKLLVGVGKSRSVIVWDLKTGERLAVFVGHNESTLCVAISPDGRTLASGDAQGAIKLWDLATRQEIFTFARNVGRIEALAFTADSRGLLVAGHQSAGTAALRLWSGVLAGSRSGELPPP